MSLGKRSQHIITFNASSAGIADVVGDVPQGDLRGVFDLHCSFAPKYSPA